MKRASLTTILSVLGVLSACCRPAPAQETGRSNGTERRWFDLSTLDARFELRSQYDDNRVNSRRRRGSDSRVQENVDWDIEEIVGFTLGGYLLDPRFLSFGGDLEFGATQAGFQEDLSGDRMRDQDNGRLLRYNLRANILPGKTISGSVYGLRNDDRISRRFQPTLRRKRTGFGTNWSLAHDRIPMTLTYDYLDSDNTGNRDARNDEHYTESTLHYGLDWNISDAQRVRISYEHAETRQKYQASARALDTTRDLTRIDHTLGFGPDRKNELRTVIRWQEESGDLARDLFEIGPQLTLKHSDKLESRYRYQFDRERYESLDIATHRLDWQILHQPSEHLTSTFDLFGLFEDIDADVATTQYGGSADWQYDRENAWGRFRADLALAFDTEDANGDDGVRLVLDESLTFRDPTDPTLRNRDVVFGSVVITDAGNRRVLLEGVDYTVRHVGNAVQIERIRTGAIADGDNVLVDYRFRTPVDGRLDTTRVDFHIEQQLKNGLTPYYRLAYRNQEDERSTGFARRADRTNHHRLGVQYDFKGLSLSTEFEIFDDTVEPYDAFHVRGRYPVMATVAHRLDAAARFSRLFFEGGVDQRNVTLIDLEFDHRWRLSDTVSTVERLAFRYEDDSNDGVTHAWDASAGVEYVWGDLSGEIAFDYDHLGLPGSNQDDFGVFFRLRREFPNVLARR